MKEKTKENASKAKAAIGSFGANMFTRMDAYMNSGPNNNNNQQAQNEVIQNSMAQQQQ